MSSFTKEQRDALPATDFAVPSLRKLPMHDKMHVRLAWDMVTRTQGLTDEQRKEARARIKNKAQELGIDTKNWTLQAAFSLSAMALLFPSDKAHPNKMPFEGVLTKLNQASDLPPMCDDGESKCTYIPREVAEAALPTILGMAVDFTPGLGGHDKTSKVGLITEAWVDGDDLKIKGFFYAADFPEVCAKIKAEKERLGFSFEGRFAIQDCDADIWVITQCVFTGAAVLYKDKAAYQTTSLAAAAAGDFDMTPEELKAAIAAAIGEAIKPLSAQNTALAAELKKVQDKQLEAGAMLERVKPHAEAIRSCAASMEAAGVGMHATQGHVNVLRHMAASMEAEATMGNLPNIYRDHDYLSRTMEAAGDKNKSAQPDVSKVISDAVAAAVGPLQTQFADLKAQAFKQVEAPQRRTISPEIMTLLAKASITDKDIEDGKLTVAQADKALDAAGLKGTARIEAKMKLMASGALPATH